VTNAYFEVQGHKTFLQLANTTLLDSFFTFICIGGCCTENV